MQGDASFVPRGEAFALECRPTFATGASRRCSAARLILAMGEPRYAVDALTRFAEFVSRNYFDQLKEVVHSRENQR